MPIPNSSWTVKYCPLIDEFRPGTPGSLRSILLPVTVLNDELRTTNYEQTNYQPRTTNQGQRTGNIPELRIRSSAFGLWTWNLGISRNGNASLKRHRARGSGTCLPVARLFNCRTFRFSLITQTKRRKKLRTWIPVYTRGCIQSQAIPAMFWPLLKWRQARTTVRHGTATRVFLMHRFPIRVRGTKTVQKIALRR